MSASVIASEHAPRPRWLNRTPSFRSQRGLGACTLAMTEAEIDRFITALDGVLERAVA